MSEEIVISKPGFDATTTTVVDDLIFSSNYNTLKYATNGTYLMTTNTTTTATLAHNLGYVPYFQVFVNQFDVGTTLGGTGQFAVVEYYNLTSPFRAARAYADSANLYLSYNTADTTTYNIIWYYKIFKNNLGL